MRAPSYTSSRKGIPARARLPPANAHRDGRRRTEMHGDARRYSIKKSIKYTDWISRVAARKIRRCGSAGRASDTPAVQAESEWTGTRGFRLSPSQNNINRKFVVPLFPPHQETTGRIGQMEIRAFPSVPLTPPLHKRVARASVRTIREEKWPPFLLIFSIEKMR
jgi:hypothetical protein